MLCSCCGSCQNRRAAFPAGGSSGLACSSSQLHSCLLQMPLCQAHLSSGDCFIWSVSPCAYTSAEATADINAVQLLQPLLCTAAVINCLLLSSSSSSSGSGTGVPVLQPDLAYCRQGWQRREGESSRVRSSTSKGQPDVNATPPSQGK